MTIKNQIKIIHKLRKEKLDQILMISSLFINPSLNEGMPRTVLEAMSIGIPIILSDIVSHRQLDPDENFVSFFKPNDYLDLRDKILFSLKNKNSLEFRLNMVNYVEQNFSMDVVKKQYMRTYKSILS